MGTLIFAAYIFAPEALGINFRNVSIFAWWLFSFFSPENPLEVIFAPIYMLINIVRNLTCWHAHILNGRHCFHVLLFSRVVIFAFFLGAKITTARKLMSLRYTFAYIGGEQLILVYSIFHTPE